MDLSVLSSSVPNKRGALAIGALLALTIGAGTMQAANVLSGSATSLTTPTASVTCSTLTGPGAAVNMVIHASGAPTGYSYTVGVVQTAGIKVTSPAAVILNTTTNTAGLTFSVQAVAGCASSSVGNANSFSVQFTILSTSASPGTLPTNDASATITDTVANTTATPLVAANVTITCAYNATGPVYIPGSPQLVSVTSAANLGTPFTVTGGGNSLPAWLVLGPSAPAGTAGTTAANFTVAAASGATLATACGGAAFGGTTKTFTLHLVNAPAADQTVVVTLNPASISPLTVTPVPAAPSITMSYTKLSGAPGLANANVTSTIPNAVFTVANVPGWLTVNPGLATVPSGGKALQFSTTSEADSLAPGNYSATIYLQVSGYGDAPVVISLLVTNKPPKLSVTTANPMAVTYILGSATTPVTTITLTSSDSPIPYSIALGGALQPALAAGEQSTGIAYSFGSNILINYNAAIFATATPGTVLTGTVTFSYGTAPVSVLVVTINVTIASPGATITSISPATLPTAAPGTVFTVTVVGSGFTSATQIGIVTGASPGTLNVDPNLSTTYQSAGNLQLKITVPPTASPDGFLPFSITGTGGSVYLGAVNAAIAGQTPTGTATLTIGAGPIIYGVTSSSSFNEVSGGNLPQLAPYDMISIFGTAFCSSQQTFPAPIGLNGGCTSTQILNGNPDPVYQVFPFTLSPDALLTPAPAAASQRQLTVTFYPHGTLANGLPAPLLFATNSQINTIVPGAVLAAPTVYDIVVSFGCPGCSPSTAISSVPYPVNTVSTDPGVFTVGSDGQGSSAALSYPSYALINSANPAGMRTTAAGADSDIIQLYVTGLGLPGTGVAYGAGSGCVSNGAGGYYAALDLTTTPVGTFANIDGDVFQTSLFPGETPPCLTTMPTVTVGGVSTPTPTYAGFVPGTVAGLYQIDVQLPSSVNTLHPNWPSLTGALTNLLTPTQLPIYVTVGGRTTQAGVMLSVAPRLKMVSTMSASATVGQAYSGTITASLGTSTYSFAITSGALPAGLTLSQTGAVLTISGQPAQLTAGTYSVTVTATDSATAPLTGSVSFTITVAGGLYVSYTGTSPFTSSIFGGAGLSLPTVSAIGGNGTYTYAITTPASLPTGLTIGLSTGVVATTAAVPAGTYQLVVTATDGLGVTGTAAFTVTIALEATPAALTNTTVTTGGGIQVVTTVVVLGYSSVASPPLTCTINGVNAAKFTCVDVAGTVTISTVASAGMTISDPYPFTVTITDTATAPDAEAGSGNYATATTDTITVTTGS